MSDKYILVNGVPVLEDDVMVWAKWYEKASERRIALTDVGPYRVSTVFLALDHNFGGGGQPVLWETMVFAQDGFEAPDFSRRYSSREDALQGHDDVVNEVKNLNPPQTVE